MSNKSSVSGVFYRAIRAKDTDVKKANYASSIMCKQYNALKKKRKQERQNKRKGRR